MANPHLDCSITSSEPAGGKACLKNVRNTSVITEKDRLTIGKSCHLALSI